MSVDLERAAALKLIIRKLAEDRFERTREIARLRAENEELRILLRSAVWELAQKNGSTMPRQFVSRWLAERRKREP